MCPQNPPPIVQEYRRLQKLLMNEREIEEFIKNKIKKIEEVASTPATGTVTEQECEDLIKKLKECKFCIIA